MIKRLSEEGSGRKGAFSGRNDLSKGTEAEKCRVHSGKAELEAPFEGLWRLPPSHSWEKTGAQKEEVLLRPRSRNEVF